MLNHQVIDQVFDQVEYQIAQILGAKGGPLVAVEIDSRFSDLGLSSLDLATLISNLETVYETDPFAEAVAITSIVTVADLCRAYAAQGGAGLGADPLDAQLRNLRQL
ncbi:MULTISPECIES: phosphopantetheine-binding protein [Pseudomonas fluorescens group]|uniref:Carrier domain-containing protein n=1 Tax=Pseudomonas fluorescens TaxID=294 RepID=A0AAE2U6U0_PSEFL|nr:MULTISPECIES: phosphopantetheine-binding protein [Pseudomonas fluorescens group]MBA1429384.1 hypothetical protein [Pseudomonas orientalis]MBD8273035.1 hypothetical protein [Pseudomonas fluorescens]